MRVLRLRGGPRERGYAHGRLLASEIIGIFEREVLTMPQCAAGRYGNVVLPAARERFEWGPDVEEELAGMIEGMRARLGGKKGPPVPALGREMTADDLKAMNSLADWYRFGCSSFTPRPSLCEGGRSLTARNLDFHLRAETIAAQIVMAVRPDDGGIPWMTVAWPGSVGAYTGMNACGVVVCLHDADNPSAAPGNKVVPRSVVLRRVLERSAPGPGCREEIGRLLGRGPWMGGSIVHVAWPAGQKNEGNDLPAAAYECAVQVREGSYAVCRSPRSGEKALLTTNHFRSREEPYECPRYRRMEEGIAYYAARGEALNVERARRILRAAAQPISILSAYFFPDTLEVYISIGRIGVPSPDVPPVRLTWSDLFPDPRAAAGGGR